MAGEFSPNLGVLVDVGADGTVRLPPDMMAAADIQPGSKVEVFSNRAGLVMRPAEAACDVCGNIGRVRTLRTGRRICRNCLDDVRSLIAREGSTS